MDGISFSWTFRKVIRRLRSLGAVPGFRDGLLFRGSPSGVPDAGIGHPGSADLVQRP